MGFKSVTAISIHFLIAVAVFVILLISLLKISDSRYQYFKSISDNWSKGPIISIYAENNKCQAEDEVLIEDFWPGTEPGCDCSNQLISFNPLTSGKCSRTKNSGQRTCNDVIDMKPIRYSKWGFRLLCGKRIPLGYYELTFASTEKLCPEAMRSCGKADSLGNFLCLPKETQCPINNFDILDKKEPVPIDGNGIKYTIIELDEGKKLVYSNDDTKGQIIVDLKLSEGKPCLNNRYYNLSYEPYVLSRMRGFEKCPAIRQDLFFDPRYTYIDQESTADLYTMNGINSSVKYLPKFEMPPQTSYTNLFSRNYMGVSEVCRDDVLENDAGKLIDNLYNIRDMVESTSTFLTIAFVISCIAFVGIFCIFISYFCCTNQIIEKPAIIAAYILGSLLCIFVIVTFFKIRGLPNNYLILNQEKCLDEYNTYILQDFILNYTSAVDMSIVTLVLSGVLALYPTLFLILGMHNSENYQVFNKEEQI